MSRKSGEIPGQQLLKLVDRMVGDAFEHRINGLSPLLNCGHA
jgi:hypothetical protein